MANLISSRPISSVRGQQSASPSLAATNKTPDFTSTASVVDSSPRIGSSSERSTLASSSEPRHSSPPTASARSSEHSFDRLSASNLSKRYVSTSTTLPTSYDVYPPFTRTTPDLLRSDRPSFHSTWTPRPSATMNVAEKLEMAPRRASPPPPAPAPSLRRPVSPAGRISNHSAEWDMHSDRGSPRMPAPRRPGPPLSAASAGGPPAASPAYAREYGSSPRASYRDAAYRDPRELSPSIASSGLKRKLSIPNDAGARRPLPDRVERSRDPYAMSSAEYATRAANYAAEQDYYRGRGRGDTPERKYPSPYSRDPAAYASRYPDPRMDPRLDDPRYSPRHAYPTSPSSSRNAYRGGAHDSSIPPYPRRSDRYSPGPGPGPGPGPSPRSPSYAHRPSHPSSQTPAPPPHDPYSRSATHSSYLRRPSPPPYASDPRPVLPPLSSRNSAARYPPPGPAPAATLRASRYTPPVEVVAHADRLSASPEPHAYSEPFYPDRRLFFARERIQDPEMDEYYHGPNGSAGPVSKPRYPDPYYDPYGSPHAGHYPQPVAQGKPSNGFAGPGGPMPPMAPHPGSRHAHDARLPFPSYGHADYMSDDPRDLYPPAGMPRMGRPGPGGVMPVPAAHVPPGPSAGIAPPPRRRGKLPKPVTDLLKTWLLEHASHPYPTEDEKRSLCSMTGLTLSQVSNWFINARRRILLPTGANGSPGGSTAAQVKAAFRDDSNSPEP